MAHLNARDVTLVCASRAPLEKLQAYKRRMGWRFEWVSSLGSELSAFALSDDGGVYHTYSGAGRDDLLGVYELLDRAPRGREEDALPFPMAWWRRHDEYESARRATA